MLLERKSPSPSNGHYFPGLKVDLDESLGGVAFHLDEYLDPHSTEQKQLYCLPVSCEEVTDDIGEEEETGDYISSSRVWC